ncbi:hypothetical protein L1787_20545 [Acuticoccus sp. M5D2P5]|uniref:hypothetical protein n=1 Tax=Acuticoccus kalidii TaxID=2910977 RepID=UPI001F1A6FE5|nr:hypothetical protein [Acuticoccus kalidii]MCF3935789.1 hypothetical protein [Acuticoccus kalidii]
MWFSAGPQTDAPSAFVCGPTHDRNEEIIVMPGHSAAERLSRPETIAELARRPVFGWADDAFDKK